MEGFEEDPAAAFLAREQDELAGIADDTLGFSTDNPSVSSSQLEGQGSTWLDHFIPEQVPTVTEEPQSMDFFGGGVTEVSSYHW